MGTIYKNNGSWCTSDGRYYNSESEAQHYQNVRNYNASISYSIPANTVSWTPSISTSFSQEKEGDYKPYLPSKVIYRPQPTIEDQKRAKESWQKRWIECAHKKIRRYGRTIGKLLFLAQVKYYKSRGCFSGMLLDWLVLDNEIFKYDNYGWGSCYSPSEKEIEEILKPLIQNSLVSHK